MVRIRLTRCGRKNRAFFRLGAFDVHTRRDGQPIEYLGSYDPHQVKDEDKVSFNLERVRYWLSVGAQPSEGAIHLLRKAGVEV